METLELPGYSEDQKMMIAKEFLIPKQINEHGLSSEFIEFDDAALQTVISSYTREAGVQKFGEGDCHDLSRVAKDVARGIKEKVVIVPDNLHKFLGPVKFFPEVAERTSDPGVATGLAWTPTGGDIIFVEATKMRGEKGLTLTGQLGDVMKESAQAALAYVRSKAKELGIDEDFLEKMTSTSMFQPGHSKGRTLSRDHHVRGTHFPVDE